MTFVKHTHPLLVLAAAATIVGCSSSDKADAPAESTSATTVASTTTEPVSTTTASPATPVAETTLPTTPPASFSAGVVLVGTDIPPGIYETDVPNDGPEYCYWERLNDVSFTEPGLGSPEDAVIAGGNSWPGSHFIIEILATDVAFNSYDCGNFTQFVAPKSPATSFGPGIWLVGQQIVPGHYESSGDPSAEFGCYWARLDAVTGWSFNVIAYQPFAGADTADITADDFAFDSNGCGNWTMMP